MWQPRWRRRQLAVAASPKWKEFMVLSIEIVKALGLAGAGVWTIFIYFTLQRNFSDPTIPNLTSTATLEPRARGVGDAQAMILRVRHQNLGKVDVRITHALIKLFYGKRALWDSDPVVTLNMPPAIGTESLGSPGIIQWQSISYDGCITPVVAARDDAPIPGVMSAYSFRTGGNCGTGLVRAGGVLEQVFDVLYTEDPTAYVGAAATFAFDDGELGKRPRVNSVTALMQALPSAAAEATTGQK